MNTVIISGRLNADPEISERDIKNNEKLKVCKYTLIQSNSSEQGWKTDINFVPCICFNKTAEIAKRYLRQGKLVTISGHFHGRTIEQNGNKIFFANIVVDNQVFEPDKNEKQKSGDEVCT